MAGAYRKGPGVYAVVNCRIVNPVYSVKDLLQTLGYEETIAAYAYTLRWPNWDTPGGEFGINKGGLSGRAYAGDLLDWAQAGMKTLEELVAEDLAKETGINNVWAQ